MPAPINGQSAIHGSTAAGSSTVKDSASQLQGARPIPVPSVLAGKNTSPPISTSGYTPDLHSAQVRQEVPSLLLKETFFFSEKEKNKVLQSPRSRAEQTYRSLLDAARNLRECSSTSPWKQSSALFEITEALTKNGGEDARVQQQLFQIDVYLSQEKPTMLLPLLLHDPAWTTRHLPHLQEMDEDQLQYLLPLLQHEPAWATRHLPLLKKMDWFAMENLLPLLKHDPTWTAKNLSQLKAMYGGELLHLLPLLQYDKAWTTSHLPLLKEMNTHQLQYLFPLLRDDKAWTTMHFHLLKKMSGARLQYLVPLLQGNKAATTKHLHYLQKITEEEFSQLSRSYFFRGMDLSSGGFTSAANPYIREALCMHNQDLEKLTHVLKTHGASRSIFNPERTISSYLTEKFRNNSQQIPSATFGVETEMFIPGIPISDLSEIEKIEKIENEFSEIKDKLNDRLGIKEKDKGYCYVRDGSLSTDVPFATPAIEQVTSILQSPEDIQRLQSASSILNDWGAFTNHTAGVHIHTGIKQWKAVDCLNTLEEKSKNRFLQQWDKGLQKQFRRIAITPYQLLFMKQFLVNMVAMQKEFYLVSRKSRYSEPNGPVSGNDLHQYYQDVSSARDYEELLLSANANNRFFNVNLLSYARHGTIEVRGFTKKNSDDMEVDPNLPVRDLIFMQDVLIKVLHDTKHILLSGASS